MLLKISLISQENTSAGHLHIQQLNCRVTLAHVFSCEICKIFKRTPIFKKICYWQLMKLLLLLNYKFWTKVLFCHITDSCIRNSFQLLEGLLRVQNLQTRRERAEITISEGTLEEKLIGIIHFFLCHPDIGRGIKHS